MTKLIALAAFAFATAGYAQNMPMAGTAAPVCPRDAEPVPPALAVWHVRTPIEAATGAGSLGAAMVKPDVAYTVSLADTAAVAYPIAPAHPGAPASHGGIVRVTVATAGTYRVAIGAGAWLDMVSGSTALPSVGHGHGPACSGIRKMVDFTLKPGGYVLQIAGNTAATIPLLIAKLG
jgi:hypothetical protein